MALTVAILTDDSESEILLARDLDHALAGSGIAWKKVGTVDESRLVIVDVTHPSLSQLLKEIDRRGRAVFLAMDETDSAVATELLASNAIDDAFILPLRAFAVRTQFARIEQILLWDEVKNLNASFGEVIGKLREDMAIVERLQKDRLPVRFPNIKGFRVQHRYLAGMKSGGDHFDLAESKDGKLLSFVLTDSSSYGLSSAVLSLLMRVTVQLTRDELHSSADTVLKLEEELAKILSERDKLSIFYGTVSRKDFTLRFVNLGHSAAFYAPKDGRFRALEPQGEALSRAHMPKSLSEKSLELDPYGRLVLLSDGFVETIGGPEAAAKLLNKHREEDAKTVLNEIVFSAKAGLESDEDMPAQDCTVALFDVDRGVLKLKAS